MSRTPSAHPHPVAVMRGPVLVTAILILALIVGLGHLQQTDASVDMPSTQPVPASSPAATPEGTPSVDDNIRRDIPENGFTELAPAAFSQLPDASVYGDGWAPAYQVLTWRINGSDLDVAIFRYAGPQGSRIEILLVDYGDGADGERQAILYADSQVQSKQQGMRIYPASDTASIDGQDLPGCTAVRHTDGSDLVTTFPASVTSCLDTVHHRAIIATVSGYIQPQYDLAQSTFGMANYVIRAVVERSPASPGTATPAA